MSEPGTKIINRAPVFQSNVSVERQQVILGAKNTYQSEARKVILEPDNRSTNVTRSTAISNHRAYHRSSAVNKAQQSKVISELK